MLSKTEPFSKQPHFFHNCYHYYAEMFSLDIINAAREHFDIAMWFFSLNIMEIEKFLDRFEWLKNEDFVFIWGREKCKHNMIYNSLVSAYYTVGELLHIYKRSFKNILIQYIYTFDSSQEGEITIKTMLCSPLNHLGSR